MIYCAIDIETDGPVPGLYSMRQLGSVMYSTRGNEIGHFSENIKPLRGASADVNTMKWWSERSQLWKEVTSGAKSPIVIANQYDQWLRSFGDDKITAICWPVSFDFPFVHYYLCRFVGESILGHAAIDVKTMACILMNSYSRSVHIGSLPEEFVSPREHTHRALDDARKMGETFFILKKRLEPRSE